MVGGELGTFTSDDVDYIRKILDNADTHYKNATNEMSECDRKQQDILHEMELVDHKYHDLAKLAIELKKVRDRRRIAKNTIELLGPITKWRQEQAGPLTKLNTVIGTMRKTEEKQKNVIYYRRSDDGKGDIIGHKE